MFEDIQLLFLEAIPDAFVIELVFQTKTHKEMQEDLLIESYGQTEPLTNRLNSILRDYPKGTQIFRELLQNADDARATEFSLMFDEREFERTGLMSKEMSKLQGFSLICYNDAVFEEKDFASIRTLGNSRKKQDMEKVFSFFNVFNPISIL